MISQAVAPVLKDHLVFSVGGNEHYTSQTQRPLDKYLDSGFSPYSSGETQPVGCALEPITSNLEPGEGNGNMIYEFGVDDVPFVVPSTIPVLDSSSRIGVGFCRAWFGGSVFRERKSRGVGKAITLVDSERFPESPQCRTGVPGANI